MHQITAKPERSLGTAEEVSPHFTVFFRRPETIVGSRKGDILFKRPLDRNRLNGLKWSNESILTLAPMHKTTFD
jgi:hypothetical protein